MKKFLILTVAMMFVVVCVFPVQAQQSIAQVQQRLERNQLEMRALNAEFILLQQQLESKQRRFQELNTMVSADQAILIKLGEKAKQSPEAAALSPAP
jgi:predicted nuclease with TOPRIM domain